MRAIRRPVTVAALAALGLWAWPPPAAAQGLDLTTDYPAVVVQPGASVTFRLDVTAPGRQRVDLAVTQVPRGWRATLRGGGFVIDGVFTDPRDPPAVQLDVAVPPDAKPGRYAVVVTGRSAAGSDALDLTLRVSRAAGSGVLLTTDFPRLRGPSDATFTFDLDLANETPQETTFGLEALGPPGWVVQASPVGEQQASSVKVAPGGSEGVEVEVDPPDDTVAGTYPVVVRASGGGQAAQVELRVEITGNYAMTLTTPDERLNLDVAAGRESEHLLLVRNDGTAPLAGIQLTADTPSGWEVTFIPETLDGLEPGDVARVRAVIRPSEDAVAGDYIVTVRASSDQVTQEVDLRATVKTSGLWGLVGILLIVAALGGLAWVFRRYGRR